MTGTFFKAKLDLPESLQVAFRGKDHFKITDSGTRFGASSSVLDFLTGQKDRVGLIKWLRFLRFLNAGTLMILREVL